jgi:hypothetical protein
MGQEEAWKAEHCDWEGKFPPDGEWEEHGSDFIASGPCPFCKHQMTVRAASGSVVTLDQMRASTERFMAFCNCLVKHEGHPEKPERIWGCGRHGLISAPSQT